MHDYWIQVTRESTLPTLHILNNLRHCTDTDKRGINWVAASTLLRSCCLVIKANCYSWLPCSWSWMSLWCQHHNNHILIDYSIVSPIYVCKRYYWFSVRGALSNVYISIQSWSHLITTNYSSIQTYHTYYVIVKQSSYIAVQSQP